MKKALITVTVEIQIDPEILDDSLDVLECLLDEMTNDGMIECGHIDADAHTHNSSALWGPLLTKTVQ